MNPRYDTAIAKSHDQFRVHRDPSPLTNDKADVECLGLAVSGLQRGGMKSTSRSATIVRLKPARQN
jgi:hypothetical protein